ncbi:hypothetical protein XENORESO_020123, partial [Xenotaenia resolanae]
CYLTWHKRKLSFPHFRLTQEMSPTEGPSHKIGSPIFKRNPDITKARGTKSEQLLRIDDHDFTMRPGFGGKKVNLLDLYVCHAEKLIDCDVF